MIENPDKASKFLNALEKADIVARVEKIEKLIEESGLEGHLAQDRERRIRLQTPPVEVQAPAEDTKPGAPAGGK